VELDPGGIYSYRKADPERLRESLSEAAGNTVLMWHTHLVRGFRSRPMRGPGNPMPTQSATYSLTPNQP
jgi:hypothetical protein